MMQVFPESPFEKQCCRAFPERPASRKFWPWLVRVSGQSASLQTERLPVPFLVRAHAWVAGQVLSWGVQGATDLLIPLSLSFFLPHFLLSLEKGGGEKYFLKKVLYLIINSKYKILL